MNNIINAIPNACEENKPKKRENFGIYLRKYKVTFTRQKPLGKYIVDFYCYKARLVIEIDGAQHYEPDAKIRDEERTKYLEQMGLKVLRFTNWDINHNLEGVCKTIDSEVMSRI